MTDQRVVRIDALPDGAWRCHGYDAVVCIDVLLSTTTVVTAAAMGRRVFPVATPLEALRLQIRLSSALVVADALEQPADAAPLAGPARIASGFTLARSLVHLSPLAEMLAAAAPGVTVYVACLRNLKATAAAIAQRHRRVAVIGIGEGGEVCAEDQMAAAWLAGRLHRFGFAPEGRNTVSEVARWGQPDVSLVGLSRSAERLRSRGRSEEVDFVLGHVDDLDLVLAFEEGELRPKPVEVARPQAVGERTGAAPWPVENAPRGH